MQEFGCVEHFQEAPMDDIDDDNNRRIKAIQYNVFRCNSGQNSGRGVQPRLHPPRKNDPILMHLKGLNTVEYFSAKETAARWGVSGQFVRR